jgi:single-stranded-DNA-specific exonuclease
LFTKFGGHAMAAGFSMSRENVDILRKRLNEEADLTEEDFLPVVNVDMVMDLDNVTFKLYDSLNIMGPFGKANKEPVFSTLNVKITGLKVIDEKSTIIFTFETKGGRRIKGVCFGKNEQFNIMLKGEFDDFICEKLNAGILRNIDFRLDIVYYITINEYNGDVSLQLNIKDFRVPIS